MRIVRCLGLIACVIAFGACVREIVPQLVRSYTMDWSGGVGPGGAPLASTVLVLVANAPYLEDQCVSQVQIGGRPFHAGPQQARVGCVRIAPGNRAELVVPDTNEQAAVAHQLEHLKGRWCHDPGGNPVDCPR